MYIYVPHSHSHKLSYESLDIAIKNHSPEVTADNLARLMNPGDYTRLAERILLHARSAGIHLEGLTEVR